MVMPTKRLDAIHGRVIQSRQIQRSKNTYLRLQDHEEYEDVFKFYIAT